jgi:hypothetical protein
MPNAECRMWAEYRSPITDYRLLNMSSRTHLLAVTAACAVAVCANAQQIANPSFEEAGADASAAAKWEVGGPALSRNAVTNGFRTGSASMAYDHGSVEGAAESVISQEIAGAKAGTRYRFSIHAMQQRGEVGKRLPARVTVSLEGRVDGKPVTVAARRYDWRSLGMSADWALLRLDGTAPSDDLKVVIAFTPAVEGPRGGWIRLDDAALDVLP